MQAYQFFFRKHEPISKMLLVLVALLKLLFRRFELQLRFFDSSFLFKLKLLKLIITDCNSSDLRELLDAVFCNVFHHSLL
jgi:hypothetical protein